MLFKAPPLLMIGCLVGMVIGYFGVSMYLSNNFQTEVLKEFSFKFFKGAPGVQHLVSGWAEPEGWGTWSVGTQSVIALPFESVPLSAVTVSLSAESFLAIGDRRVLIVRVAANGADVATLKFTSAEPLRDWTFRVPRELIVKGDTLKLALKFESPISPLEAGKGSDTRKLGIGLKAITLRYKPSVVFQ